MPPYVGECDRLGDDLFPGDCGRRAGVGGGYLRLGALGEQRGPSRRAAVVGGVTPGAHTSRWQDPGEKIGFMDDHWVKVTGGHGLAEVTDEAIHLAIALRNVGSGLAVLHGWSFYPERHSGPGRAYRSVPPERSTPCRPHLSIARPPPSFHGRGRDLHTWTQAACPPIPLHGWINSGSSPHLPCVAAGGIKRPQTSRVREKADQDL
jgi:hypothetical protein